MTKKTIISTVLLSVSLIFSIDSYAQKFPALDESPMDVAAYPSNYKEFKKEIKITYSRPSLKDRDINELVPLKQVWRTGANEAAELTLYQPMKFGDKVVPAGTYTFYIMAGKGTWTGIISRQTNVWGSYYYNEELDVARHTVKYGGSNSIIEDFSIVFEKSDNVITMHLGWEYIIASFPFTME